MTGTSLVEEEQAAMWVARMDSGDWQQSDEAELQAWLASDRARHGLLLRTQAAWLALDPESDADENARSGSGPDKHRRWFLAAFGGMAAATVGGLLWFNAGASYRTEIGEIRRISLADGSVVAINTASMIEVRLEKQDRRVELKRGEAWFQIAKDRSRPFVVRAGNVNVVAVGTAFSVRRLQHGAEILVTEGVVETWGAGGARVRLAEGERAFVGDAATVRRHAHASSSIDRALAWRTGKIDLLGDTLDTAIGEFNRYNARKLVLGDPKLAGEQLDGVFRIDDVEGFARAVGSTLDVPVDASSADEIRIG